MLVFIRTRPKHTCVKTAKHLSKNTNPPPLFFSCQSALSVLMQVVLQIANFYNRFGRSEESLCCCARWRDRTRVLHRWRRTRWKTRKSEEEEEEEEEGKKKLSDLRYLLFLFLFRSLCSACSTDFGSHCDAIRWCDFHLLWPCLDVPRRMINPNQQKHTLKKKKPIVLYISANTFIL